MGQTLKFRHYVLVGEELEARVEMISRTQVDGDKGKEEQKSVQKMGRFWMIASAKDGRVLDDSKSKQVAKSRSREVSGDRDQEH